MVRRFVLISLCLSVCLFATFVLTILRSTWSVAAAIAGRLGCQGGRRSAGGLAAAGQCIQGGCDQKPIGDCACMHACMYVSVCVQRIDVAKKALQEDLDLLQKSFLQREKKDKATVIT